MITVVTMPKLGLTMKDGVVGKWLKKEGETVEKGEALLEITTDKLTNSVEAEGNGVLRKILVPEGEKVPCQTTLCIVADPEDDISDYCK